MSLFLRLFLTLIGLMGLLLCLVSLRRRLSVLGVDEAELLLQEGALDLQLVDDEVVPRLHRHPLHPVEGDLEPRLRLRTCRLGRRSLS